jgi:hypothetical protein
VKPIGRAKRAADPVMTTCAAHATADSATSRSPCEKEPSVPPPSSQVPSADSAAAGQTMGFAGLPVQPHTMNGVMTT